MDTTELPPPEGLPERYTDLGPLAVGGMGEVRRVHDGLLDRTLALKLLQPDNALNPWSRWRFEEEGRVTAQLQHPGIVPVHDRGELPDGRLWYTMREIAGDTLDVVMARQDGSLPSIVGVLEQVCRILAYAHAQQVIHRDVKPENVVVGPFGEVMVLDWGVARRLDQVEPAAVDQPTLDALHTRDGTIVGTPAYMAPEQAYGDVDAHGPHSDVYAVGTILYEVLAGRPPYDGASSTEMWQQVLAGPPPDIATVCEPPEALADLVRQAMHRLFDERPTMLDMAERLRAWRDRDAARERARERVAEAAAQAEGPEALRAEAARSEAEALAILSALPARCPPEDKFEAWALQDQAQEIRVEAEIQEQRWVQILLDALEHDPDCVDAHRQLAGYWKRRLAAAEAVRDRMAAARAEVELERHDVGGWHTAWLRGDATLVLQTEPPGARATLYRIDTIDRRRVPVEPRVLGTTPLEVTVPPGSYQVVYELDGYHPATYLAAPDRAERWDLVPPGATEPEPTVLLPWGELPDGCVYVPAGWFRSGGDDEAIDPLPAARVWVDGFVIQARPVTLGDWMAYLQEEDGEVPRQSAKSLLRKVDGVWVPGDAIDNYVPRADRPAVCLSAHGVAAYARWWAARTCKPWGLPHDEAWEKAARGADGRIFPWGDHLEPAWCAMISSFEDKPEMPTADAFPEDRSPYGMLAAAGLVRDWCGNGYRKGREEGRIAPVASSDDPAFRMIRGGTIGSLAVNCRLAGRYAAPPTGSYSLVGFRLAYTVVNGPIAARAPMGKV